MRALSEYRTFLRELRRNSVGLNFVALLVLAGVAEAAPIQPPAGWTPDDALAEPPAATRFGGTPTKVTVWAYKAGVPGAVLHVSRAEAPLAADDRDRLASAELEEPRAALRRQTGATAEQDNQRYDAAAKQLEAYVKWRDASLIDATRMLIAADARRTVAVTGQCLLAADAAPALVSACEAALATLDPEVPAASRVPLALVPVVADAPQVPSPAVLDDPGRVALPPIMVDPPAAQRDMRPIYLGAGLIVIAGLAWWNRKRREKFEQDHPREGARRRRRDDDADDLHAAAEAGDDGDKK